MPGRERGRDAGAAGGLGRRSRGKCGRGFESRSLSLAPISRRIFYHRAALIGYLIWCEDWLLIKWSVIMLGIESRGFEVVNEETTKKLRREW